MKQGKATRIGELLQVAVAILGLAVWCSQGLGQQTGGGTTGGGGTGATAAPTGSSAAPGGGGAGTATTTVFTNTGTGTGKATSGLTPSILYKHYSSPLASGWAPNIQLKSQTASRLDAGGSSTPIVTKAAAFGVPMFTAATSTTGAKGATTGKGMTGTSTSGTGFSTIGQKRAAGYYTTVDRDMLPPPVAPMQAMAQTQSSLTTVLAQSVSLQTAKNLVVSMEPGNIVVLRGIVETERDRRTAEGLVRMEPGVYFVRNEIVVNGKQP